MVVFPFDCHPALLPIRKHVCQSDLLLDCIRIVVVTHVAERVDAERYATLRGSMATRFKASLFAKSIQFITLVLLCDAKLGDPVSEEHFASLSAFFLRNSSLQATSDTSGTASTFPSVLEALVDLVGSLSGDGADMDMRCWINWILATCSERDPSCAAFLASRQEQKKSTDLKEKAGIRKRKARLFVHISLILDTARLSRVNLI